MASAGPWRGSETPWRELCLLLLLLSRCSWVQAPGTCHQLTVADGFAGEMTSSGGLFDPANEATAQECATVCGQLGVAYSAVETMDLELGTLACLCAPKEEFELVTASSTECTACSDGSCGGVDGIVMVSPAAEDLAALTVTVAPAGTPVVAGSAATVSATADVNDVEFTIQAGDRSPAFNISGVDDTTGTSGATMSQEVLFYYPGTFTISVSAQKRAGKAVLSQQVSVNVTQAASLLEANCPPVQEPNIPYFCGAAVTGSDTSVTATFSDGAELTAQLPTVPIVLRGSAPPQSAMASDAERPTGSATFLVAAPFDTPSRLLSVRTFGSVAGTCTGEVVTPTCTDPDVFCPGAGCTSSCGLVPDTTAEYQCTASTFCPLTRLCSAGAVDAGTCGTVSAPAGFAASGAVFSIPVSAGAHTYQEITTEVLAQPGDMIQVTCTDGGLVAAMAVPSGGDLDSTGVALTTSTGQSVRHLLEVVAAPLQQFSWAHTCVTPVQLVTFTAALPDGASVTNATSCEYIIRNMSISLMQANHEMVPDTKDGPIYLDTALPVTVRLQMLEGAPALMNWDYGTEDLPHGTQDLQARVDPATFYNQTVTYPMPGTFIINGSATNTHSETLGATWATQEVILQNPVVEAWAVEITNTQILTEPTNAIEANVNFLVKLPETERLPTDASIYAHFGDGYHMEDFHPLSEYGIVDGETLPEAGFYSFTFTHHYAQAGLYNVTIDMKNEISNVTLEIPVDVEEKIIDFAVEMKFELNDALSDGLGDDENEFHNDKNITFIMLMTQGSVTRYELYNTSSGVEELLQTFKVENKLHPTVGEFYYYFSENQELNITFKAFNTYEESDSVEASIWIKDPVTEIEGIMIVEGEDVTSRGEDKPINITFNCASTHSLCLVIDYGDGAPLAAYGDEGICMANFSEAKFQPNDLTMPMIVEHTYWADGKYNLTAILFNPVSFGKASLTFLVVPFSCKKPIITVNGASLVKETANGYFRSNPIVVDTETYIPNCEVPFTSIERWMVSKIDPLTGETIEPIVIQNILPSWNKSSLLIKKNFLDFGLYKLDYSKQLYEGDEPPNIPYEVMTTSYVVVIRSPLVAIMVPGSVSRLVRGWGQQASLDPGSNSIDPDLPEDKSFECEWYCRQLTEEFPMNGTVMLDKPLLPVRNVGDPVPSGRSGCFGSGPGRLDFNSCKWDIDTNIFHPAGEDITFHLVVVIKKNGRRAESFIDLEMVSGKPPMMTIKCVSPKLCSPTEGGVFINPENRLGLIGNCSFDCYPPLTYEWTVSMVSNNSVDPIPIDDVDKYIMSEPNTKYLSLSKTIYSNYSTIQKFHVSLKSNNSHPSQKLVQRRSM
ncbi:uncharacterized protein LOC122370530 [Amphibalanus amphitrite]|uniref:uncharacterized protein LOC122370530 n=1 Tax=Amphibalanus amphitrite TaxID=1232801 RepID=UPI001C91D59E|nr:uncharacterized protein LOC122370530 [Amphibalanus amphitrite]